MLPTNANSHMYLPTFHILHVLNSEQLTSISDYYLRVLRYPIGIHHEFKQEALSKPIVDNAITRPDVGVH